MILLDREDLAYFERKLAKAKHPTQIHRIIEQIKLLKSIMKEQI